MLIIFAYSYRQALGFLFDLIEIKPECKNWKVNKDFKIVTEDHKRAYSGYRCDIVFLTDWSKRVRNYNLLDLQEEIEIRLHIGDFIDKTKEYLELLK